MNDNNQERFVLLNGNLCNPFSNKNVPIIYTNDTLTYGDGEELASQIAAESEVVDKFTWTNKATLLLIDEYHQRKDAFRNPKIKKILWNEISDNMISQGYNVDSDMLDRKWRNMKCTYNKIRDNNKRKNTGRGKIHWEYYNRLSLIFVDDKTINPSHLTASLPLSSPEGDQINDEVNNVTVTSASISELTPQHSRAKQKRLDIYRKRQLDIDEQKLEELKKIRMAIEENNNINRAKLNLFEAYLQSKV